MIAQLLLLLIRAYQVALSPFLGGQCRFEPSCSRYAYTCIERHGALRGSLLSVFRLCKCQPFHPGGYDPPPPPKNEAKLLPRGEDPACAPPSPRRGAALTEHSPR